MIIMIVMSLLVIGIAFFQVLQGLFSALVMALLTTLCVALALNYFEPLGDMLASNLGVYAYGAALMALFVIPLYVLREVFDRLIRGNVVLGLWPDRIGGGLLGTYSAFLMVGILSLVMQSLPWNENMLGWQGYDTRLTPAAGATPRWSANFALGVGQHLSDGPLSTDHPLAAVHADLPLEFYTAFNRPPGAAPDAPAGGVTVAGAFVLTEPERPDQKLECSEEDRARFSETAPQNPLLPANEPTRVYVIRTVVGADVAKLEKDTWWRLAGTQFRLVGDDDRSYYPVGYLSYSGGWKLNTALEEGGSQVELTKLLVGRPIDVGAPLRADWVYRLPVKVKPQYLVFRGVQKLPIETAAHGLPKPLDEQGATLALSAKPREGSVKFDIVGNHFLRPDLMTAGDNMPPSMSISIADIKEMPKGLSQLEIATNRGLRKIAVLDAMLASLSAASSATVGGVRCYALSAAPGTDIVTTSIDLDPGQQADMAAIRAKLSQLKPVLMLGDGSKVGHRGMYLQYKQGDTIFITMYYDTQQADNPPPPAQEFFIKDLSDNIASGVKLGVIFNVPNKAALSAVGMDLGIGREGEMFLPAPLLTANKAN